MQCGNFPHDSLHCSLFIYNGPTMLHLYLVDRTKESLDIDVWTGYFILHFNLRSPSHCVIFIGRTFGQRFIHAFNNCQCHLLFNFNNPRGEGLKSNRRIDLRVLFQSEEGALVAFCPALISDVHCSLLFKSPIHHLSCCVSPNVKPIVEPS